MTSQAPHSQTHCFEISAAGPVEAQTQLNKWLDGFIIKPTIQTATIFIEKWEDHFYTRVKVKYQPSEKADPKTPTEQASIFPIEGENEVELNDKFMEAMFENNTKEKSLCQRMFLRSNSIERAGKLYAEVCVFLMHFPAAA